MTKKQFIKQMMARGLSARRYVLGVPVTVKW